MEEAHALSSESVLKGRAGVMAWAMSLQRLLQGPAGSLILMLACSLQEGLTEDYTSLLRTREEMDSASWPLQHHRGFFLPLRQCAAPGKTVFPHWSRGGRSGNWGRHSCASQGNDCNITAGTGVSRAQGCWGVLDVLDFKDECHTVAPTKTEPRGSDCIKRVWVTHIIKMPTI